MFNAHHPGFTYNPCPPIAPSRRLFVQPDPLAYQPSHIPPNPPSGQQLRYNAARDVVYITDHWQSRSIRYKYVPEGKHFKDEYGFPLLMHEFNVLRVLDTTQLYGMPSEGIDSWGYVRNFDAVGRPTEAGHIYRCSGGFSLEGLLSAIRGER